MMPPTSIDGTDITGATIDGTDVTEITVDGQTVFSAQQLPVAYSNLVAWYPFDSATYGGSNADDVTAIIGGSGDDTAYNGTVNGGTYQSSGGVTDINGGANSGYYDFTPDPPDYIDMQTTALVGFAENNNPFSFCCWVKPDIFGQNIYHVAMGNDYNADYLFSFPDGNPEGFSFCVRSNGNRAVRATLVKPTNGVWQHIAGTCDGSRTGTEVYVDGSAIESFIQQNEPEPSSQPDFYVGAEPNSGRASFSNIEDVRVYNKELSSSEVNQIYQNTKP